MGEIGIVGSGKTRGYPYPVCKKKIVDTGETRGYPYLVCKKLLFSICLRISRVQDLLDYPHMRR